MEGKLDHPEAQGATVVCVQKPAYLTIATKSPGRVCSSVLSHHSSLSAALSSFLSQHHFQHKELLSFAVATRKGKIHPLPFPSCSPSLSSSLSLILSLSLPLHGTQYGPPSNPPFLLFLPLVL